MRGARRLVPMRVPPGAAGVAAQAHPRRLRVETELVALLELSLRPDAVHAPARAAVDVEARVAFEIPAGELEAALDGAPVGRRPRVDRPDDQRAAGLPAPADRQDVPPVEVAEERVLQAVPP